MENVKQTVKINKIKYSIKNENDLIQKSLVNNIQWNNNKKNLESMQTTNNEITNYIINLKYKLIKQLEEDHIFLPKDKTQQLL